MFCNLYAVSPFYLALLLDEEKRPGVHLGASVHQA